MIRLVFVLIFTFYSILVSSQNNFELMYGLNGINENSNSLIQLKDSNFYLLEYHTFNNHYENLILEIDKTGFLKDTNIIQKMNNELYTDILEYNNNIFLLGVSLFGTNSDSLIISKYDSGNLYSKKTFFLSDSCSLVQYYTTINNNGDLILSGILMNNYNPNEGKLFAFLLDANFNIISNNLDILQNYRYISPLLYDNQINKYLCIVEKFNVSFYAYLDSAFNIDTVYLNSPLGYHRYPFDLLYLDNYYYFSSRVNKIKVQITKFNSSFNEIKKIIVGDSISDKYPSSFASLVANDNFLFCAYSDSVNYLDPWWGNQISRIKIFKYDTNLNIVWEATYLKDNKYIIVNSIISTNDGGCIITGNFNSINTTNSDKDIFVLKVDSTGIINCLNEPFKFATLKTHPNPASYNIFIDNYNIKELLIFDINGNLVKKIFNYLRHEKIDISNLNNGTYFLYGIDNENNEMYGKFMKVD